MCNRRIPRMNDNGAREIILNSLEWMVVPSAKCAATGKYTSTVGIFQVLYFTDCTIDQSAVGHGV
jgi:hypothetical protein